MVSLARYARVSPEALARHRVSLMIRCATCGGWVGRLDVPLCGPIRSARRLPLLCGWEHRPESRAYERSWASSPLLCLYNGRRGSLSEMDMTWV